MQDKVRKILGNIRQKGVQAIGDMLHKWDGVRLAPGAWRVPEGRMKKALAALPAETRAALEESAERVEKFHRQERRHLKAFWEFTSGSSKIGQKWTPVDAAGIYVPGGRFAYPSTVLMTAIPARVAGVKRIVVCTPPRHMTVEVLAACRMAGVNELYQLGGVAAVGALAYGNPQIKAVDIVVGPGGVWVTEAKRQIFGVAGIDALAGPSEIVLIADGSVPASFVAADMMAQAEHDPQAVSTLVATSKAVLNDVRSRIDARFLGQCRFFLEPRLKKAAARANELAPEHLSLMVKDPKALLKDIKHAGAVFCGPYSPVAAGDYWAGPSHVLPTGRAARFSSGLSVLTFMKRSSVMDVSRRDLLKSVDKMALIAEKEGLFYHAASLRARAHKKV
jgi:histidinol dehydrogenase